MTEPELDPYAAIAEWYDVEHDGLSDDLECYQALLTPLAGHVRVLEIGSGTGRLLAGLASAGFGVTGVEPSVAMRARCARRLATLPERVARRVRVVAGTAEEPGLAADDRFDAALVALGTFAHLVARDARQCALDRLRAHLRPDGLLLLDLDLLGPRRLAAAPGQLWCQGVWPVPGSPPTALLTHLTSAVLEEEPGTLRVTHLYDVCEQGGVVRRSVSAMSLALLAPGEVELALRLAGFAVERVAGGYDLAPFEEGAPRAIFVARRAPG